MAVIEVGRVCVKLTGREAGSKCVVVDIVDSNFVLITGPKNLTGVKRRRVNIMHIEPTDKTIEIEKGASDEKVEAKIKEQNLTDFMKEKVKVNISVI
ncbi:50S ribosomal protein L14e [Metallosphaera tengchongensis]|uniref:Large ribosomal subunit protein eL14 n=1 Tax=Metallosphaera tengchongensis TaxID=1532350 RepID=A0A6N0NSV0_9CREN|nr:50S ribosomal protein L14e [Metallosphaera tengchongensis]QKQ99815.1 50S ribosomal protein L14e [Metallosphaera tengchongensis]